MDRDHDPNCRRSAVSIPSSGGPLRSAGSSERYSLVSLSRVTGSRAAVTIMAIARGCEAPNFCDSKGSR